MAEYAEPRPPMSGQPGARSRWRWLARLVGLLAAAEAAIVLGIGLGAGMVTDAAQRIVSVVGLLVYFAIVVAAPYTGLLVWLVLYPFTETNLDISLGGSIPDLSPTRMVMAFLAIMLMAQVAIRKRPLPRLSHLDFWGLLFVAGIGLSTVATPNPIASIKAVIDTFLAPLIFYYLAKYFVTERHHIEQLFNAFLIIGAYSAFLAINEQLTGQVWLSPNTGPVVEYAGGIHVLQSLWGTNAVFGSIFALVIPIGFYRFVRTRDAAARLGYGLLSLAFLAGMFFTYKRAAWVAMLASFVILFVLYPPVRRGLLALVIVSAIPIAALWPRIARSALVEDRLTAGAATLNGRTTRWQAAIDLWREKPIFGQGFSNFDQLSGFIAIENHYLNILVSGGLVAFIPFVIF